MAGIGFPIGKYVFVRSRNEGVNAGVLMGADSTGCVLWEARRLWSHIPKEPHASWYEGVSVYGLKEGSKVSTAASQKYIIEDYSITLCSAEAEESIRNFKAQGS